MLYHKTFWTYTYLIVSAFQTSNFLLKKNEGTQFTLNFLKRYLDLVLPVWVSFSTTFIGKETVMSTKFNPLFDEITSMNFLQMSYDALVTSFFRPTQWSPAAWIVTIELAGFAVLFGLVVAS